MPFPQIALAGPILATFASGAMGGRAAAAMGFVSYVALNQPGPGLSFAAAAVAAIVAWAIPMLMACTQVVEARDRAASAIVIECDGFASLDTSYGAGTSAHVFGLLRLALTECCGHDVAVQSPEDEWTLFVPGVNPSEYEGLMARVERRFAAWISDAGYDCDLTLGLTKGTE